MSKLSSDKPPRLAIALDPDRLALLAGAVVALLVMIVSAFVRHADLPTALLRAGIAMVVCYAATFILVAIVKRVTLTEVAIRREAERRRILERKQESEEKPGGTE